MIRRTREGLNTIKIKKLQNLGHMMRNEKSHTRPYHSRKASGQENVRWRRISWLDNVKTRFNYTIADLFKAAISQVGSTWWLTTFWEEMAHDEEDRWKHYNCIVLEMRSSAHNLTLACRWLQTRLAKQIMDDRMNGTSWEINTYTIIFMLPHLVLWQVFQMIYTIQRTFSIH